jgi:hypothetical protein
MGAKEELAAAGVVAIGWPMFAWLDLTLGEGIAVPAAAFAAPPLLIGAEMWGTPGGFAKGYAVGAVVTLAGAYLQRAALEKDFEDEAIKGVEAGALYGPTYKKAHPLYFEVIKAYLTTLWGGSIL